MQYTVKAAARATGVTESTLRTWERRYGVPRPGRTTSGRRLYEEDDLSVIRRMAALLAAGLPASEAARAARRGEAPAVQEQPPAPADGRVAHLVAAATAYDEAALHALIHEGIAERGWPAALEEIMFPALRELGAGWATASIASAQEHFATELVRRELAAALHAQPAAPRGPTRVLLACPEGERHDLGLSALALFLRQTGLGVIYLGADVPQQDLVAAVEALLPDAVCLAATSSGGAAALARVSRSLIARRHVRLFIGGPALPLVGLEPAGLLLPPSLAAAAQLIAQQLPT